MLPGHQQFNTLARLLHWTMAVLILAMLGIGVAMVTSLADYHVLISLHRPLGMAILVLVVVRFCNRILSPPPPLPPSISASERWIATISEWTMYGLMLALPLVGWGMLSAAHYPIVMYGSLHLPFILPQNAMLYAWLRSLHTLLAYLFFATFVAHFAAILFHTFIVRDGLFLRMAPWTVRPWTVQPTTAKVQDCASSHNLK